MEYREEVMYINGYKVTNRFPVLTPEQEKKLKEKQARQLYELFQRMDNRRLISPTVTDEVQNIYTNIG